MSVVFVTVSYTLPDAPDHHRIPIGFWGAVLEYFNEIGKKWLRTSRNISLVHFAENPIIALREPRRFAGVRRFLFPRNCLTWFPGNPGEKPVFAKTVWKLTTKIGKHSSNGSGVQRREPIPDVPQDRS
jgi:hypothetical protein